MKRTVLILVVLLVPAGFLISAWQSYTHQQLAREIKVMEERQQDLLDGNKIVLTTVARMESPLMVIDRARSDLNMQWPRQDQLRTLRIGGD